MGGGPFGVVWGVGSGPRAAPISFPAQPLQTLPLSFSCIFLGDPGRVTRRRELGVAAIGRWGGVLGGRGRAGLAGRARGAAGRPAGVWPRGGSQAARPLLPRTLEEWEPAGVVRMGCPGAAGANR